jgi:phytoene desaturase
MKNIKKITIIGSGFSALAASAYLAQSGYDVTVFEKTMLLVVVLDN